MKLKKLAAAFAAGTLSCIATAAVSSVWALPMAKVGSAETVAPIVQAELAHGCHRGIQRDYSGWHYHARSCARIPTAPPGLYDNSAYRRHYRGPRCTYQCRHIGPVKTCQQVCR